MVPVKQSVQINFAGGLDLKTDSWQVGPTNFLSLNNSIFTTGGRLTKRNGFGNLGNSINAPQYALTYSNVGANLNFATKCFAYNNELCINDRFNLYSRDQANNALTYKGRSTILGLSTSNIAQDINTKINMDVSIDTTSGVKIYTWFNDIGFNDVRYSIQDIATGQFIVNNALFGGAQTYQTPRCVSISGQSWVFAVNTNDGKLYAQFIVGQTVTGSPIAVVSDLNASEAFYDIDFVDGGLYLTYFTSGPAIKIDKLDNTLAITASITKSESATNGLSFFGDGTNIWVVYNNGTDTKAFIVNNAVTTTVLAPAIVDAGSGAANVQNVTGAWSSTQSKAFIFYDQTSTDMAGFVHSLITYNTLTVTGTAGTAETYMRSVLLVSKAFSVLGIPHVCSIFVSPATTTLQNSYFLLNIYNVTPSMGSSSHDDVTANIACKIAPDEAGSAPSPGYLCGAHNPSGSIWEMALGQKTDISEVTSATTVFSPVGVIDCQYDFSYSNPDQQVLGNNSHIGSGELIMYDGGSVVEQNFHIYPEGSTASNGSSGDLSAGSYGYIFTYEWQDNQGQLHRSSPSPVTQVTASANTKNTLVIPTLRVTNKGGSAVNICIYRTIANGSVYFLVASTFGTVLNDPQADTVTYTDSAADSAIIENLQIYTTGEVDDYALPATKALTNFKNRIMAVPFEGGYEVDYSKQVVPGFPVEFSPEFVLNVGTVAGTLTTIAGMDDKTIFFKSGLFVGPSIVYMVGTGPAASGANNDFTDPLPVAVDCGCIDRSSIVLTPNGLIFKSDKGIYLLDRSLNASYIGSPVEAYNQYDVVSSQLIPNTTQVRFLLSNGILIMYDYFYSLWATFTNPAGVSDCIFQGQHTYVSSSGEIYQETPGIYVDGTSVPVLMNFTTSWIKLAGLQGYQRSFFAYFLAEYLSPHQWSISTYTNFSSNPDQNDVITPISTSFLENWRLFFKNQRCQSFQIQLQEIYTGTPGPAFTMSGMNLIVGAKSKFRTIPAAQSVG